MTDSLPLKMTAISKINVVKYSSICGQITYRGYMRPIGITFWAQAQVYFDFVSSNLLFQMTELAHNPFAWSLSEIEVNSPVVGLQLKTTEQEEIKCKC